MGLVRTRLDRKCYCRDFAITYGGQEADYIADVAAFIDSLREQDLIVPVETNTNSKSAAVNDTATWPKTYKSPLLEAYSDMQDLLLLDPIHDTDDVG